MTSPVLRISLADVARLAQVQRPAVSMWRSRSRTSDAPFPAPSASADGQDWFDALEVVSWLERTGRGNNPTARLDLAVFGAMEGDAPTGDAVVFAGLTALLCLSACTGRTLGELADADLLGLADECDEDDALLYREIDLLGDRRLPLARSADQLCDAAYTPQAALESLMARRFRLFLPGHTEVALTEPTHQLIAELTAALIGLSGAGAVVDPTAGGSDLLIAAAGNLDGLGVEVRCTGADDPASRLARRRLRVHDLHAIPLTEESSADQTRSPVLPRGSLVIAQYPTPARPEMLPHEVLSEVDGLALQLHPDQFAVVVAPASVLIGRLDESVRQVRSELLRMTRVRAMVRLPAGLVRRRPREQLALWLLGPLLAVSDGEARVAAADLTSSTLDEATRGALVTDLIASLDSETSRHYPHFMRQVAVSRLLAQSGALLPPVAAEPFVGRAPVAAEIASMLDGFTALRAPVLPPVVAGTDEDRPVPPTTVGAALAAKALTAHPGHRLHRDDIGSTGTPVIGVVELLGGESGARRIDRLVFATYERGRYTEPGDIVFCTAPRPAAWVDGAGGSVVEYPARVLRVSASAVGLGKHTVADDLRRGTGNLWRSWPLRVLPVGQSAAVDAVLAQLRRHHDEISDRIALLDRLADHLTVAVSAGTVRLSNDP